MKRTSKWTWSNNLKNIFLKFVSEKSRQQMEKVELAFRPKIYPTRMHSIRMHTIRSLLYWSGSLSWGLPDRETPGLRSPQTETPWTETPWTGTPWTENPLDREPPDRDPPGRNMGPETETPRRNMGPGSQTGSDIIQRSPPPWTEWQTRVNPYFSVFLDRHFRTQNIIIIIIDLHFLYSEEKI